MHLPYVSHLQPNNYKIRSLGVPLQQHREHLPRIGMLLQIQGGEYETKNHLRPLATYAPPEGAGDRRSYSSYQSASSALRRARWLSALRRRIALRLHSMEPEDWILLMISLGWCGIFAGATTFNAW